MVNNEQICFDFNQRLEYNEKLRIFIGVEVLYGYYLEYKDCIVL